MYALYYIPAKLRRPEPLASGRGFFRHFRASHAHGYANVGLVKYRLYHENQTGVDESHGPLLVL